MSTETLTQSNHEQSGPDAALRAQVVDVIESLPHIDAKSEFGLPAFEFPATNKNEAGVPRVILIGKRYVDFLGTDVEAPKNVTEFDVPYYVIGHNDDNTSLLVAEAKVEPYGPDRPLTEAEIMTQGRHRQALLPNPDNEPRIFTLDTSGMMDRLRNKPSIRKRLATRVLQQTFEGDIPASPSPDVLPIYSPSKLSVVDELSDEMAEAYRLQSTLADLHEQYSGTPDQ